MTTLTYEKYDALFERLDRVKQVAKDVYSERVFCAHEISRLLQNMDDDGCLWLSPKDVKDLVSLTKVDYIDWESM